MTAFQHPNQLASHRCPWTWPKGRRTILLSCTLAAALWLTGCSKQLLGSLDEVSANQVVSALRVEGISAEKSAAGEKAWKVTVPNDQFAEAVQVLERRNLPPQQFQGLGQVFKKESLVSTPTEERARLIHAMSQELERSLMQMDGVLVARVHPVILPHDPLNPKKVATSASVLIKYRPGMDMNGRENMVRSLVASGIEGLSYDDVRVVMVPAETYANGSDRSVAARAAPSERTSPPRITVRDIAALSILIAGLVLSFVLLLWKRKRSAGEGSDPKKLAGRWTNTVSGFASEHDARKGRGR